MRMREKTERPYLTYIPEMALAILIGPFHKGAILKELKDAIWYFGSFISHLVIWLLCIATYLVSVPVLAWLAKMSDRHTDNWLDKNDREWFGK